MAQDWRLIRTLQTTVGDEQFLYGFSRLSYFFLLKPIWNPSERFMSTRLSKAVCGEILHRILSTNSTDALSAYVHQLFAIAHLLLTNIHRVFSVHCTSNCGLIISRYSRHCPIPYNWQWDGKCCTSCCHRCGDLANNGHWKYHCRTSTHPSL